MNGGIEMLLARMDTHPEEFIEGHKWGRTIQELHKYAEKEESTALNDKLKKVMMQHLTEQIMEELIDPKSETVVPVSVMPSGGQTQGQLWAQSQLQQAQATQAHIQLHQQQLAAQSQATQYNGLVGAGQGLLSSLFGGKK